MAPSQSPATRKTRNIPSNIITNHNSPAAATTQRRKGIRIGKALNIAGRAALVPAKIVTAGVYGRRPALAPAPGEQPVAILRVQVVGCNELFAKDGGGKHSDPFVIVTYGKQRVWTPTIKKSLNPVYDPKTATFDFPLYLSLADRLGPLEFVVWDKDIMMRKEYLGEVAVRVEDWFPEEEKNLAFDDEKNLSRSRILLSSRRRAQVSGTISFKLGLVPVGENTNLDQVYTQVLQKATENLNILSAPPTESIGTFLPPEQDENGNENEQYEDDGLSSEEEDEVDELEERDLFDEGSLPPTPRRMSNTFLAPPTPTYPVKPIPKRASSTDSSISATSVGPPSRPSSRPPSPGTLTPGGKPRKAIFRRRRPSRSSDYNFSAETDILGIVMLEIAGADDLPKIKNSTGLGWDMDPFTVISFGKKVFRTRVIRHSLTPRWEEKLLFHVHEYEQNFQINFTVLDWDKITSNDHVGDVSFPLADLLGDIPEKDPQTGLYPAESIGAHDMKELRLALQTQNNPSWEGKFTPTLTVKAKYQPYDALRQRFWRQYLKQYDADDTNTYSRIELTSMLDSLGSTLTRETIDALFSRHNKNPDTDELSSDEAVISLEETVNRPAEERRKVSPSTSVPALGTQTPSISIATPAVELEALDFSGYEALPANYDSSISKAVEASIPGNGASTVSESNQPLVETLINNSTSSSTLGSSSSMTENGDVSPPRSEHTLERVINIKTCPLCHRPRLNARAEVDIVTHLAVCASSDWGRVDRMIVGNFVTSSQAQRKWLAKAFASIGTGAYKLGANSANIIVQNRITGQLEEEKMQIYVRLGIRIMYRVTRNQMEGLRAKRLLKSMSIKQGMKYDSPASAREILPFIAFHKLNVKEIADPLSSFKTFNEFFYRKLKDGARPVTEPENPKRLVSCADCRMMAFESVTYATKLWIKGRGFTVQKLLGEAYKDQADKYEGGALAIFRLAPQDYHRFHSPVDGTIGPMTYIAGEYYTVNPQAIRTALDVYGENARKIVPIDSPQFGRVMAVCIGAMMVGSIITTVKEGEQVVRGQEFGYFAFGGSTIVLLFEKGTLEWDEDLLINGRASLETLVRMGMGIGRSMR
ncbi:hypothetical protein DACRYDRAFT_76182 [Dacryopinax primogenitus]|uniref:Phosphatidylserine decarboxylase proenzyme 2 n=1 Tax=Dacryopinax primogenitus (strain DJM 731) TaxID=1858805 RepID=M5GG99_DACPD|nr:uncharacterized protein DACRYDRAFT_76182 [Dacryopinax primogenitus]EJU05118.1 hypothetical protein DACRYDRAFT_76182 [Dacryopinax primogenitus]